MTYKWFYFDFIALDDLMIVITFHDRPYFLSFDISILDICIYQHGKKKQYSYTQPAGESALENFPLQIAISKSKLMADKDSCLIQINEKDVQMELELKPEYPHWKSPVIALYKSEKYYFNWRIFFPSLRVKGYLNTNGNKIPVQGRGYLDANEGNYLFNKFLKSWIWGRFYSPVDSFIFGSLCFKNDEIYQPAIYVDHENSNIFNLESNVTLNDLNLEIPVANFKKDFKIKTLEKIDTVNLIISKIPEKMRFLRKVHEYSFDRLNRRKLGRKFASALVNVKYNRYKTISFPDDVQSYQGILETINFF